MEGFNDGRDERWEGGMMVGETIERRTNGKEKWWKRSTMEWEEGMMVGGTMERRDDGKVNDRK